MSSDDDGFIVFPYYGNPMADIDPKRFRKSLQKTLARAEYGRVVEERDLARDLAVALEQECAELRRQVDELLTTVSGLSAMVIDQDSEEPVTEADLDAMALALRTAWRRGFAAGKGAT